MYKHLLVPLDGSELSIGLITQAVEFARTLAARITFFSARADVGASGDGALLRSLSPDAFVEAAAGEASAILAKALAAAGACGLNAEGVARTGARPFELILAVAAERGCDLIFMASHGHRGLKGLMLGSQTEKLLAHSTLPVLVASVESNVAGSAAEAAIGIIKDEHRVIAAIVQGLRRSAMALRVEPPTPDLDFIAGMLHYLKSFPEVLHHPKEERFLFARLAQRSEEAAALIEALEAEHRAGSRQIAEIEVVLGQSRSDARQFSALAAALDAFGDAQWQHIGSEEKLILPAARRHLTEEDWCAIAAAFRDNAAVHVGGEADQAFKRMFVRLMNLASDGAEP